MTYVTSDLHGYRFDEFVKLLKRAGFGPGDELYVIGDVIDRNTDGGIALLQWMLSSSKTVHLLRGNHEDMLLKCERVFMEADTVFMSGDVLSLLTDFMNWQYNGAECTIASLRGLYEYDREEFDRIMEYIKAAPIYRELTVNGRKFLLVHGGLNGFEKGKQLSEYPVHDLLWSRPAPEDEYFDDVLTIIGHTPTQYYDDKEGRAYKTRTWIDIDTGAGSGGSPMLLRLEDMAEFY